jgi:hypothetical protein
MPAAFFILRPGHSNVARLNLDLAKIRMGGECGFGDPLGPVCYISRTANASFCLHLVGDHAARQQDTECTGETELVADAIELDHCNRPSIPPKILRRRTRVCDRSHIPKNTATGTRFG